MSTEVVAFSEEEASNAMKVQRRRELAALSERMLWFNRAVTFAGNDKIGKIMERLNILFPKEVVPAWVVFVDMVDDYLRDEFKFYKDAQADPCEYCDLYEQDEPMIEEINAFLANNKDIAPKRYTPEFAAWLREMVNE